MTVQFCEYRLVRPDGTVLRNAIAPEGAQIIWDPAPEHRIYELVIGQYRDLPNGEWVTAAEFPEGYPGPSRLPGGGTDAPA